MKRGIRWKILLFTFVKTVKKVAPNADNTQGIFTQKKTLANPNCQSIPIAGAVLKDTQEIFQIEMP